MPINYFEKYDKFIGLGDLVQKSKLFTFKKKLLNCLNKDRPLLKEDIDNYNKFTLIYLVDKGNFTDKNKAKIAIKYGKTQEYNKSFPDDEHFISLIKNIYEKLEL